MLTQKNTLKEKKARVRTREIYSNQLADELLEYQAFRTVEMLLLPAFPNALAPCTGQTPKA